MASARPTAVIPFRERWTLCGPTQAGAQRVVVTAVFFTQRRASVPNSYWTRTLAWAYAVKRELQSWRPVRRILNASVRVRVERGDNG